MVVTGNLARKEAEKQVFLLNKAGWEAKVKVFNIDVAVFINEKILAKWINESCNELRDAIIVLPGGVLVNPSLLLNLVKCREIRIVKGPTHISDLYMYIQMIPIEEWTLDDSIDTLYAREKYDSIVTCYREMISGNHGVKSVHSNIVIPVTPPPFIPAGELYVDSYFSRYLENKLKWIIDSKFPIIVLGSINNDLHSIERWIRGIEQEGYNGIIGLDATPSCKSMELVSRTSAELFLSIDSHHLQKLERCIKKHREEIIPVLTPHNTTGNKKSKLASLGYTVRKARELGIDRFILDPILPPPYTGENTSILDAFLMAKNLNVKYGKPLLLGLSNYIELTDADSPGLVFSLIQMSIDARVSLGLFAEESYKTQGVLQEAFIAAIMNSYSAKRNTPPKNMGIDLLVLKDKRRMENNTAGNILLVRERDTGKPVGKWDPLGHINIAVDYNRKIVLVKKDSWNSWIGSGEWRPVIDYLLENNEISSIGHAFYIGKEIYKAVLALKLGKDYIQDQRLFKKNYLEGIEK